MKQKLIKTNGHSFLLENGILYEEATLYRVKNEKYLYVNNYGLKPFDILVIDKTVFFVFEKKVKEISTYTLLEGKYAHYFFTATEGDEKGNGIFVFSKSENRKPMLLGRSYLPILDDVYKIGKKAYQVAQDQLLELCECYDYDTYFDHLEIHTDEKGYSVMYTYKKCGGIWQQINKWVPGSIKPQKDNAQKSKTRRI